MYDWAMDAFREFAGQEVVERNNVQQTQNNAIASTQAQLDKLLDISTRGLINDYEYKSKNTALKTNPETTTRGTGRYQLPSKELV